MIFNLIATNVIIAATSVTVTTDFSRSYSIMGESHLDRTVFFNLHGNLGEAPDTHAWMEDAVVNDWRWVPSRGFLNTSAAPESTNSNGFSDTNYWTDEGLQNPRFLNASNRFANLEQSQVWCNQQRQFPNYMGDYLSNGIPVGTANGYLTPTNAEAFADICTYAVSNLVLYNSPTPDFFEFLNEPSGIANWGYHWAPDAYDILFRFCNTFGQTLHNAFPDIQICAPSYSWPYMESGDNFTDWEEKYARFAYAEDGHIDCYSQHLYERDYSSGYGSINQYAAQYETDNKILSQGKLRAHLDLIDNYSHRISNGQLPSYVFTEAAALIYSNSAPNYVRRNTITDWEPQDFFNASKVLSTFILTLMERPDRTEKFVPFINLRADHWTTNYPWVVYHESPGGTNQADYTETEFVNFLKMWSDVSGDFLFSTSGDSDKILSKAFFSSNAVYIVAQNIFSNYVSVSFQNSPGANTISSIDCKRYRKSANGTIYFYDWHPANFDLNNVVLYPDELIILKATLTGSIVFSEPHLDEQLYYGNKYMLPITANNEKRFGMTLPTPMPNTEYIYLDMGLSRSGGFTSNPIYVRINDTYDLALPDLSNSIGITAYWKTTRLPVPSAYLNAGYNTVQVKFPDDGGYITSCKLVLGETD